MPPLIGCGGLGEEKLKKWILEHKKRVIAIAVVIVIVIVGIVSCSTGEEEVETQDTIAQVEKRTLVESVSATGNVMASDEFEVKSKASGVEVLSVNVEVGDTVSPGQVICTMDSSELQERLNDARQNQSNQNDNEAQSRTDAQENLDNATTTRDQDLQELNDDIASANSNYQYAKSTYETSKSRYESLLVATVSDEYPQGNENDPEVLAAKNQMTQDEQAMNDAKRKLDNLNSRYESNVQRINKTYDNAVNSYNNTIKNLDSSDDTNADTISDLQEQIADCQVVAPVGGMITAINVSEGDTFNSSVVALIDNVDMLDVQTEIDEYDINSIVEGQKVIIKTNATGDDELTGVVKKVSKIATDATTYSDSGSKSTGLGGGLDFDLGSISDSSIMGGSSSSSNDVTFTVTIGLDKLDARLRIGMTAKISIITKENENVTCVPYNAVQTEDDGKTFFVEKVTGTDEETGKPKTSKIVVTKGIESDYYTEIKSNSLKVGDEVLVPAAEGTDSLEQMINNSGSMGGVE